MAAAPAQAVFSQGTRGTARGPHGVARRYNCRMECPKCKMENGDAERFCRRCHATLLFMCPACAAAQRHGGTCDKCGVDFTKYAFMVVSREQSNAAREHENIRDRASIWKQIILLPVTGGYSLIRFFLHRDA